METNEKLNPFVRIRGVKGRGAEVIKELVKRGGYNALRLKGEFDDAIYYIGDSGVIDRCPQPSRFIMQNYEEITLPTPKRWRAECGEIYYYIDDRANIVGSEEMGVSYDNDRHEYGNYFRTKWVAESARERILKMLKER